MADPLSTARKNRLKKLRSWGTNPHMYVYGLSDSQQPIVDPALGRLQRAGAKLSAQAAASRQQIGKSGIGHPTRGKK